MVNDFPSSVQGQIVKWAAQKAFADLVENEIRFLERQQMVNDEPPPIEIRCDHELHCWQWVVGSHRSPIKEIRDDLVDAKSVILWIMGNANGPVKVRVVQ